MRPLFWHYQDDPVAVAASDQFLLGHNLLIAPILRQGGTARNVYLPKGEWFDFWTGERHLGGEQILAHAALDSIPVYVRAGAIIPMARVQQFVGEHKIETINLHIWPGTGGILNWYEDDGSSLAYTSGDFHERRISASLSNPEGTLEFSAPLGNRISETKTWRIILRNSTHKTRARLNNRAIESRYDKATGICSFEIPNFNEPFAVQFH
jgi:alpha-glucosidase